MRARLLLLAAALAAFGGSLVAGFHLDDYAIFSDPLLRSIRGPHPLTNLTFWLNYQLGGQEPLGYHALNLLLELGAVLLAYECLRRLLPPTAAVIAAAIFAVHPLQAEAVNYVAARGVMLAALFCFAALLAWIEDRPWLSVVTFGVALLADQRCVLFPLVFLVVRTPRVGAGPGGHPVRERSATIALACTFALAIAAVARTHVTGYALALVTFRFLRLLIVPWGFTIDPDVHEPLWLAITAAALILAAIAWTWRKTSAHSELTWLLAGLLLLIPNFSANPAADPRMYLPMFAFAAAAGLLLARVPVRHVAIGLILILAAVSVSRTYVWMSEERLWREAVRRAPDKVEPKIQLAKSLKAADALELLGRARQLAPYNAEIPAEIGKVLLDEQQFDGALDELSRAVALNPKNALAFNNRGVVLASLGHPEAAAADFEHALVLDPTLAEAQENLKRLGAR
jgi:tetratricopeptide (TPR) repeat protein